MRVACYFPVMPLLFECRFLDFCLFSERCVMASVFCLLFTGRAVWTLRLRHETGDLLCLQLAARGGAHLTQIHRPCGRRRWCAPRGLRAWPRRRVCSCTSI